MAKKEHYFTQFEPERYYHVYNRSVDLKPMFTQPRNYEFFLERLNKYLTPVLDVYSYCLMNNHFHLLVKIKDWDVFEEMNNTKSDLTNLDKLSNPKPKILPDVHQIVSHRFRKMFQSYAMAFNKQENRIGTLFQTPFKRVCVNNERYFIQLVYYIHANPQLHGFTDDFKTYPWSSYKRVIMPQPSKLKKEEVFEWFGGREGFIDYHSSSERKIDPDVQLEDE
jgi:REP element-mobilizing transposase RayT